MLITKALIFCMVCAAVFAGLIVLQLRLSRMDSRWPGLVLPILSLLLSLSVTLGTAAYTQIATGPVEERVQVNATVTNPDGTVTEYPPAPDSDTRSDTVNALPAVLGTFVLSNIPTAVYLTIYFTQQGKYKKTRQVERMNIQDL